jgi:hypothetical protein
VLAVIGDVVADAAFDGVISGPHCQASMRSVPPPSSRLCPCR